MSVGDRAHLWASARSVQYGNDRSVDSVVALNGDRTTGLVEGGASYADSSVTFGLLGYVRLHQTGLVNAVSTSVPGAAAQVDWSFDRFRLQSSVLLHGFGANAGSESNPFPQVGATATVTAVFNPFRGALFLEPGLSASYDTPGTRAHYAPYRNDWVMPSDDSVETPGHVLLNAFVTSRIGTAYFTIEMYNVFGAEIWNTERYPAPGRTLSIGITWTLID